MSEEQTPDDVRAQLVEGFAAIFGTAPGTGPRAEIERYVDTGKATLPDGGRLLAWDANSVHGFVFDTANAAAVRGASALLSELDDEFREGKALKLQPQQILFAGGGSGMAVVNRDQERDAVVRLHRRFAEQTRVATCCTASVELDGNAPFHQLWQRVQGELLRERARRGSDVEPAVPFFVERCVVCGRRAAAEPVPRQNGERLECEVCRHVIDTGRDRRDHRKESADFEDIADLERGGFLAVLYADGNGIGSRIAKLQSPLQYRLFSRALDDAFGGAFKEVAGRYGLEKDGFWAQPKPGQGYQLPIQGGDDLVAILPGEVGVPFARALLREIETRADGEPHLNPGDTAETPIGVSAGIAIGKKGFPIRHLLQEAEDLLESAKRRVYQDRGNGVRSALDFGEIADGLPRRASRPAQRFEPPEACRLLDSGRPYGLREFDTFAERLAHLRKAVDAAGGSLGRSQLFILRDKAGLGPAQLRNHVLYQVGRQEAWRDLIAAFAGGPEVLLDPVKCSAQIVPEYGGELPIFDVADMLALLDHWRPVPGLAEGKKEETA